MIRPLVVLAALLLPCVSSCKTTAGGSSTKDISSVEKTGLFRAEQAIYYVNGTEIFRAVCPGNITSSDGNARAACTTITAQASVSGFRQTMQSLYSRTFGAFGTAESQELDKLLQIMGNQSQTFTISPGGLGQRFMTLMNAAIAAAPDGRQQGRGGGGGGGDNGGGDIVIPPPQQQGLLAGPINTSVFQANSPGELTINGLSGASLSRIRVQLSDGCPFQTVGVTVGQGAFAGGPRPLSDASRSAGGLSTMWAASAPVQPIRLFLTFTGQPGTCQVQVFDGNASPGDPSQGGGGNGGGSGDPVYVLSIFSNQGIFGLFSPNKTHTFAFFAQLDPSSHQILDYVPISWLPVLTDDNTGQPILDGAQNLQVGPIRSLQGTPRMGYTFSMSATIAFARRQPIGNGTFIITADLFNQAKSWHDALNANTAGVVQGQPLGGRFLYVADDRDNYPNDCTNPRPDALNCFHAFSALTNNCLHTGIASGLSATVKVMGLYQELGLIRQQPTVQFGDQGTLLREAMAFEQAQGGFDRP